MGIRKPRRATRTFIQKLVAGPERVFPLLCPVREADWLVVADFTEEFYVGFMRAWETRMNHCLRTGRRMPA